MTDDVLIQPQPPVARIRLNRPRAIHALNTPMCAAMLAALTQWRDDPAVRAVVLDHAEGRGFCAGGDIRMIAESGASDGVGARTFFRTEYQMNHALFTFPKPVVAFMDGITMGGGVGIAMPARYRVATEATRFAMPETGIGLFPDVGGGWYLSRLPGRLGAFIALTGARLNGAECLALGLATHFVPADAVEAAKAGIMADPEAIETVLARHAAEPGAAPILAERERIDRLFAGETLEAILADLAADDSEWAQAQLAGLRTKSPQACKVSLRLLAEARAMPDFAAEMRQEYAVACRVAMLPDFIEGVRAVILDKDNQPRWSPSTAEGVTDAQIDRIFAPLPAAEAWQPA